MKKRQNNRGFSLIELMVVLLLSFIIVGAIYTLYVQSVSAYRVESQMLDMQDRLRFGLEHMKRDLRRAGFLATPHSTVDDNVCPKPDVELRAITVTTNPSLPQVYRDTYNDHIQPSTITLFGDFFSGRVYRTTGISNNQVILDATANFPATEVEFDQLFMPYPAMQTRYLRIVTSDQFEMYFPIIDADFPSRTISLADNVPTVGSGSLCAIAGFGEGLDVNVVGFIRYRILFDTREHAPVGKSDLVREELQVDGQTVVPNSQLVIADYAVDLQLYDFGFDMDDVGNSPNFVHYALVDEVADEAGGGRLGTDSGTAIPHRLRYVTVKLTVRTEAEDPEFPFAPRESSPYEPLVSFDLSDMKGSCRTTTLASRVQLTSLAVRNLVSGGP